MRANVRTGRVAIEAAGTLYRVLHERESFAPATGGAEERPLGTRADVGDYRIATAILLSDPERPVAAILRFGSRLPTTDNAVGLERDAIDFFATLGARVDVGPLRGTTELGLGIHGTRLDHFEQSDVLVYILGVSIPRIPLRPAVFLLGQADAMDRAIRGNEHLSELRIRVRSAGRVWLQAEAIKGLVEFSPGHGIAVSVGTAR